MNNKPCPFCGGEAGMFYDIQGSQMYIAICRFCFYNVSWKATPEEAWEIWNERSDNEKSKNQKSKEEYNE